MLPLYNVKHANKIKFLIKRLVNAKVAHLVLKELKIIPVLLAIRPAQIMVELHFRVIVMQIILKYRMVLRTNVHQQLLIGTMLQVNAKNVLLELYMKLQRNIVDLLITSVFALQANPTTT